MSNPRTVDDVAQMDDAEVAKGLTLAVGIGLAAAMPAEKIFEVVAKMVADIRAAERLRIERSAAGAKVAAECLKGEP